MSVRSWRWTSLQFVCLDILVLQQGCSSKEQTWALSLAYVRYDRCIWLLVFFSYFFCQPFVYSVAFWCHPSTCLVVKTRGLNEDFSMSITLLLYLSFSFSCCWLVDLCQGLPRIWLWGRMYDPYVKESFLTAIPQSSRRDIQPCIVSSVDFSLIIIFTDW